MGSTNPTVANVHAAGDDGELAQLVTAAGRRGVLARGLGRSYGDAAQNGGGVVLDMTPRDQVLSVDTGGALVEVEAGASLDRLMRVLLPLGLFVPVTPGTRQVTVGGAIAADVHGKNHHVDGSFGRHVVSMDLLCADGTIRRLTPESGLFWATVGGMGLTGVILRATLRMKKVESAYCLVDTERCADLDDLLGRMAEGDDRYTYSVAWIDCLARGASLGRSVLTRGWAARLEQLPLRLHDDALDFRPQQLAAAPRGIPSGLLNRMTVAAFNEVWFRKAPRERRGEIQSIAAFFHPLDGVARWNRIYGPRGFLKVGDPAWRVRRRLLTGHEHLRPETFEKMWNALIDTGDPGLEILGAYIMKEDLRALLALAGTHPNRHEISGRLSSFYEPRRGVHRTRGPPSRHDRRHVVAGHLGGPGERLLELEVGRLQPPRQTRGQERFRVPQPDQPKKTHTLGMHPPTSTGSSQECRSARLTSKSRRTTQIFCLLIGLSRPSVVLRSSCLSPPIAKDR